MDNKRNIAALIGLVGAIGNNGKTENTDKVVREALLAEDSEEMVTKIHKETYTISPSCRTCASPCGNTSDYDISKFEETPEDVLSLKMELIAELRKAAERITGELPEAMYRGIAYVGYDLEISFYRKTIEELKNLV